MAAIRKFTDEYRIVSVRLSADELRRVEDKRDALQRAVPYQPVTLSGALRYLLNEATADPTLATAPREEVRPD